MPVEGLGLTSQGLLGLTILIISMGSSETAVLDGRP